MEAMKVIETQMEVQSENEKLRVMKMVSMKKSMIRHQESGSENDRKEVNTILKRDQEIKKNQLFR